MLIGQGALIVAEDNQGIFFSGLARHYQEDLLYLQFVRKSVKE